MDRRGPISRDLMGVGTYGLEVGGAAERGAGYAGKVRGVVLVGAVEGVGGFEAEDGVGDVAHFDEAAGLIGGALLGSVAGGGAAEGAVGAEGDAGLGDSDAGSEGRGKYGGQKEEGRMNRCDSHEGLRS